MGCNIINETEKILKNIFKSLKKNGTCLIMIYNKNSIRYYLKGLYYLFFKLKIFKGYNLDTVQKLFTDGYYQRHFTLRSTFGRLSKASKFILTKILFTFSN